MAITRKLSLVLICGIFLTVTACQTKEQTGAAVGGASGAGLGALIGGSEHRAEGAIIGGLIGGAAGYFAGTKLSEKDQKNVYDVLENTPTGQTETWTSDKGVTYHVTPTDTWNQEGRKYRSLDIQVDKPDGEEQNLQRVAYKTAPDAKWQLTQQTAEEVRQNDQYYNNDQYEQRRERGYYDNNGQYNDQYDNQPEYNRQGQPYPEQQQPYPRQTEPYPDQQNQDEGIFE